MSTNDAAKPSRSSIFGIVVGIATIIGTIAAVAQCSKEGKQSSVPIDSNYSSIPTTPVTTSTTSIGDATSYTDNDRTNEPDVQAVRIELGDSYYKSGPRTYALRNGDTARVNYEVIVIGPDGDMKNISGCYAKIKVLRGSEVYDSDFGACWLIGGFNLPPGEYTMNAEVSSDWGTNGADEVSITVTD